MGEEAVGGDAARRQDQDGGVLSVALGNLAQDAGFTHTCVAPDDDEAPSTHGIAHRGQMLVAGEARRADGGADVGQGEPRLALDDRKDRREGAVVPGMKPPLGQLLRQRRVVEVSTRRGLFQDDGHEGRPQRPSVDRALRR